MRPVPIPDEMVWPDGLRMVIAGGPNADATGRDGDVAPVEAIVDHDVRTGTRFSMLLMLEPGDMAKLEAMPFVWLSIHASQLPAFALTLEADR